MRGKFEGGIGRMSDRYSKSNTTIPANAGMVDGQEILDAGSGPA